MKVSQLKLTKAKKACPVCGLNALSKNAKYCSNQCQKDELYLEYISNWKKGLVSGARGLKTGNFSGHVIRYMFTKYKGRCALCGWHEINAHTGKSPLEIDHIDGNSENNTENNLTLLCPNCHSLTSTYKNANIGRGRLWRKQKYMLQ